MIGELISAGANLLGGWLSGNRQDAAAEKQAALQREFAQNGIQWKVNDANKAGINPYYALGASTASYSPVSIGDGGIGKGLSDASQDIGRAVTATSTAREREDSFTVASKALALKKGALENDLLAAQVAKLKGQIGPPMPALNGRTVLPGQGVTVDGDPIKPDDIKQQPSDAPSKASTRPFGYKLNSNPYFSDGQTFEDRYGDSEIANMAKFVVNQAADHYWTYWPSWGQIYNFGRSAWRGGDRRRYNVRRLLRR